MDEDEAQRIVLAQSQAPAITKPVDLSPEDQKAYEPPLTLAEKAAAAKAAAPKRGPGRPPGAKNRATIAREQQEGIRKNPPARMVTPPPKKAKPTDELTREQRVEHKLARAEKLGEQVADTINDNLFLLLMAMGAPSDLIYKPGRGPKGKPVDSPYTGLGEQLALGPMQAAIIGRFLAEMESTEVGGKTGAALTDGKGPLIIYGLLSLASVIQYGKGLMDAYTKIEPLLTAYKVQQEAAEAQKFTQQQTGGYTV